MTTSAAVRPARIAYRKLLWAGPLAGLLAAPVLLSVQEYLPKTQRAALIRYLVRPISGADFLAGLGAPAAPPGAVARYLPWTIAALAAGKPILCDVRMVQAGIPIPKVQLSSALRLNPTRAARRAGRPG